MAFARFMARPLGRGIRIIAGLAIMGIGFTTIGGTMGVTVTFIGSLPVMAGLFNVCLLAPFIHAPFSGKDSLAAA